MVRHHPEPTKPKNTVKHKPVPIGKIISEAKKAGLSYGQYVARRTV
jgi:hypothetical protein